MAAGTAESSHFYLPARGRDSTLRIVQVFYFALFGIDRCFHVWYICGSGLNGIKHVWHICTCDVYMMCVTCVFTRLSHIFAVCGYAFVWLTCNVVRIWYECIHGVCMRHVGHVWVF